MFPISDGQASCTIKSAVSPEFPDGLHKKYLSYIADKSNCKLDVTLIPFARRVASLRHGNIDLMVGLKDRHEEIGFHFLHPHYESIRSTHFVLKENASRFATSESLTHAVAGVTIDEKSLLDDTRRIFADIVPVTNLEQKIQLLAKKRIDIFIHFESSALFQIKALGLEDEIIISPLQISKPIHYHVAMHNQSPLMERHDEFEKIIADGVKSGDFDRIRATHEAMLKIIRQHDTQVRTTN